MFDPQPDSSTSIMAMARVGTLREFDKAGQPRVEIGNLLLTARSTTPLSTRLLGQEVVVIYEDNDPLCPIIMGVILAQPRAETTTIEATKEVVIRCGESSLTLTSGGKVMLRGSYVLSRSTGVNRILGGSVQIN